VVGSYRFVGLEKGVTGRNCVQSLLSILFFFFFRAWSRSYLMEEKGFCAVTLERFGLDWVPRERGECLWVRFQSVHGEYLCLTGRVKQGNTGESSSPAQSFWLEIGVTKDAEHAEAFAMRRADDDGRVTLKGTSLFKKNGKLEGQGHAEDWWLDVVEEQDVGIVGTIGRRAVLAMDTVNVDQGVGKVAFTGWKRTSGKFVSARWFGRLEMVTSARAWESWTMQVLNSSTLTWERVEAAMTRRILMGGGFALVLRNANGNLLSWESSKEGQIQVTELEMGQLASAEEDISLHILPNEKSLQLVPSKSKENEIEKHRLSGIVDSEGRLLLFWSSADTEDILCLDQNLQWTRGTIECAAPFQIIVCPMKVPESLAREVAEQMNDLPNLSSNSDSTKNIPNISLPQDEGLQEADGRDEPGSVVAEVCPVTPPEPMASKVSIQRAENGNPTSNENTEVSKQAVASEKSTQDEFTSKGIESSKDRGSGLSLLLDNSTNGELYVESVKQQKPGTLNRASSTESVSNGSGKDSSGDEASGNSKRSMGSALSRDVAMQSMKRAISAVNVAREKKSNLDHPVTKAATDGNAADNESSMASQSTEDDQCPVYENHSANVQTPPAPRRRFESEFNSPVSIEELPSINVRPSSVYEKSRDDLEGDDDDQETSMRLTDAVSSPGSYTLYETVQRSANRADSSKHRDHRHSQSSSVTDDSNHLNDLDETSDACTSSPGCHRTAQTKTDGAELPSKSLIKNQKKRLRKKRAAMYRRMEQQILQENLA